MTKTLTEMSDEEFNDSPYAPEIEIEHHEPQAEYRDYPDSELVAPDDNNEAPYDEGDEGYEYPQQDLNTLLEPFSANGKEIQVRSVDEARQLMQMGANYTKKMQQLSPNLRLMKSLEANGLLDESSINYLIDLHKGNPNAVNKVIKDHEIDTYELGSEESEYTPTNHQVSEQQIELDEVLGSIEGTPSYARCVDLLGNQWDQKSRNEIVNNPAMISQINEQINLGIYDQIQAEIDHVRVFGGLKGMTDLEAYKAVGSQLYNSGRLVPNEPQPKNPVARTQPPQRQQNQARRAASAPNQQMAHTQDPESYNPLEMSDEEFLRINNLSI